MSNEKRVLPVDEEYLCSKNLDYSIYAMLQTRSYLSSDKQRFVYKDFSNESLCKEYNETHSSSQSISKSTFGRRISNLKIRGMIVEGQVVDLHGKLVNAFILPEDYKIKQLIPLETMRFLSNTTNSNVIKTYVYLLSKFIWKNKTHEYYSFTKQELYKVLGVSATNSNGQLIDDILKLLNACELITTKPYYERSPQGVPVPRIRLINCRVTLKS